MKLLKNGLAVTLLSVSAMSAQAADYMIDGTHSFVQFAANHMGFSKLVGHFNQFDGEFSYDESGTGNVAMTIQVESIDTNHEKRDAHLKSPDFFDARQYPTMTFKSNAFDGSKLTGDLTILGVSVPTSFDVEKIGFGPDPWGGTRIGFVATTVVDRTDFGMNYSVPGIPAEVEVSLFIEGIMKK